MRYFRLLFRYYLVYLTFFPFVFFPQSFKFALWFLLFRLFAPQIYVNRRAHKHTETCERIITYSLLIRRSTQKIKENRRFSEVKEMANGKKTKQKMYSSSIKIIITAINLCCLVIQLTITEFIEANMRQFLYL